MRMPCITIKAIQQVFVEEVQQRGGQIKETVDVGRQLFVRSLLPSVREVRPLDRLHGGLALRVSNKKMSVHPYVFRTVCSNGAIIAHTLASRQFQFAETDPEEAVLDEVREAIGVCSAEQVFTANVDAIRRACHTEIDLALTLMPIVSRLERLS